jgi:hypothetical protein
MAEDQARLAGLLAEVRQQLTAHSSLDEATRRRLEAHLVEVEEALGAHPSGRPRAESLAARLGETAAGFEASHPNLAVTVGGIIDALGQLGI